jgi:hypothetical protein
MSRPFCLLSWSIKVWQGLMSALIVDLGFCTPLLVACVEVIRLQAASKTTRLTNCYPTNRTLF